MIGITTLYADRNTPSRRTSLRPPAAGGDPRARRRHACATDARRAPTPGGRVERGAAVQPALRALLLRLRQPRLPRRAHHRAGLRAARRPGDLRGAGAAALGRRAADAVRHLRPHRPRAVARPAYHALDERHAHHGRGGGAAARTRGQLRRHLARRHRPDERHVPRPQGRVREGDGGVPPLQGGGPARRPAHDAHAAQLPGPRPDLRLHRGRGDRPGLLLPPGVQRPREDPARAAEVLALLQWNGGGCTARASAWPTSTSSATSTRTSSGWSTPSAT